MLQIYPYYLRLVLWSRVTYEFQLTSRLFKSMFYIVWIWVVWMKFRRTIHHVVIITWPISVNCIASLPFINPLLNPLVKCPSNAHFRIRIEVEGHPGTFHLLFFEYYEYTHATLLVYCFKIGKNLILDTARMCKSQLSHFWHSKRFTNNSIVKDPTHPSHSLFQLLPSGRRYRSIRARSARLLNSFSPGCESPEPKSPRPPSETPCTPLPPETWTTPQPYHTKEKNCVKLFLYNSKCATHRWVGLYKTTCSNTLSSIRGANLSPFGEICRFHLEIGHSRESCRSVKKYLRGGGGRSCRRICESSVSRHL